MLSYFGIWGLVTRRRKLGRNGETCGKYQSFSAPGWFLNTFPSASKGDAAEPEGACVGVV